MSYKGYSLTNHDEIAKLLKHLTDNKNDITHLNISGANINDMEARLLATFLASDNCVITDLNLSNNNLAALDNSTSISDAMAQNRSIINLDISNNSPLRIWADEWDIRGSLDLFVSQLALAIQDHPCIRSIDLSNNAIRGSTITLADYMPKSLRHINLSDNKYMDHGSLAYLMEHCHLRSIDISRMEIGDIFKGVETCIVGNTSLLKLDYTWYHSVCTVQKNEEVKANIELMLLLNRKAIKAAKNAALCLIAIRKFRRVESGLLGLVPKELVLMIAKYVYASYVDVEWRIAVASPTKKARLCLKN
jgi:hypothetical protein